MRTDLIINYASLEGLSSLMTSYKEALNNVYTAMDSLKEKLSTQESKAINKLKESMGDVGSESGNTIDTLDSLANVINNYTADMRDLVNAETEGIATRVDTSDIWFNLQQIKSSISYLDEMDYSLTGAYHCETGETAEEKKTIAKYESNYNTIENFRKTKLVALKNKVYSYMEDIDEIYDKRLKEYENLDDSYRKKIDSIYSEFTSGKNKFFDGLSFVGSVSWNFLKSFVKAAGAVVAVALVPEVAIVLLLLGEAKYAGCAIITYFPEDLFDSDLWHKIYNYADKEMSGLAEVSRVALERGPLGLIGYLGQGYADKVQTPEGIASTTGEVCGTVAGALGVKNLLSPEGQAGTSDVGDVEAGGIGDTEVGGVGDVEAGNVGDVEAGGVGDVEAGGVGDTTPGNISDTEAGKITDIEAGSGDTNITISEGGSDGNILTSKEAEEYAFNAIKGPDNADSVVLGKYESGSPTSYDSVAKDIDAQYFNLDNWNELSSKYTREEIWKINERFLDIQTSSGREIYLSHNPFEELVKTQSTYYKQEINYLLNNGYHFVKEGDLWHAIR